MLTAKERAERIRLEILAHVRGSCVLQPLAIPGGGAVYQNVKPAEFSQRLRDQGLDRFFVAQIRLQSNRFDAPITIPSYGFVRFRGRTAVVNHQSVTTVYQRIRDVSADALPAPVTRATFLGFIVCLHQKVIDFFSFDAPAA